MPPDETECENCGAFVIDEAVVRLSRAFGIDREKALALFEKGYRHPKQLKDRDPDEVLTTGENGLLYLCTNCGGFVAAGDSKCARCGAEFESGPEEAVSEERDILDLVLCPVCGADNEPERAECDICGENLRPTEEPPAPMAAVEEVPRREAERPILCPTCGSEKSGVLAPCPVCDHKKAEPGLAKVDAFLEDLEAPVASTPAPEPERPAPAVRPIQRVPKVSKIPKVVRRSPPPQAPPPRGPHAPPEHASRPAPKTTVTVSARTPRPVPARPTARSPPTEKPDRERVRRTEARKRWAAPPPEYVGAIVAASGVGLTVANVTGEIGVIWGVAFVLSALCVYVLAAAPLPRDARLGREDAVLLTLGAAPGLLVPAAPALVAPIVAVAGAIPLALAARRLLKSPARSLLVVASALPLIALAVVAGNGLTFAGTESWILAVLASLPWPLLLVIQELVRHRFNVALHRELNRAERDISRRDYAGSLRDYDRAIELSKKGAVREELPWYGKGATLILLGRYAEALRAIDTALDINPRNEVAWLNKGNALMRLGQHMDALRCFNAALKVNPKYEVAWNNKGNALARLEHYEEALRCYERALAIDSGYRGAWINMGYVLTKLGRYDEAASCADRALRLEVGPRSETA